MGTFFHSASLGHDMNDNTIIPYPYPYPYPYLYLYSYPHLDLCLYLHLYPISNLCHTYMIILTGFQNSYMPSPCSTLRYFSLWVLLRCLYMYIYNDVCLVACVFIHCSAINSLAPNALRRLCYINFMCLIAMPIVVYICMCIYCQYTKVTEGLTLSWFTFAVSINLSAFIVPINSYRLVYQLKGRSQQYSDKSGPSRLPQSYFIRMHVTILNEGILTAMLTGNGIFLVGFLPLTVYTIVSTQSFDAPSLKLKRSDRDDDDTTNPIACYYKHSGKIHLSHENCMHYYAECFCPNINILSEKYIDISLSIYVGTVSDLCTLTFKGFRIQCGVNTTPLHHSIAMIHRCSSHALLKSHRYLGCLYICSIKLFICSFDTWCCSQDGSSTVLRSIFVTHPLGPLCTKI